MIYKLKVNSDNGFQAILTDAPKELIEKKIYEKYVYNSIDCIKLNLKRDAFKTDFLSMAMLSLHGFPVSDNALNVIKNHILKDIQIVDLTNITLLDYKFVFFNGDLTNYIDYKKSNFQLIEDFLGEISIIDSNVIPERNSVIDTYNDNFGPLIYMRPQNGYHFLNQINIKEFDMFRIGHFDYNFYVSEKLKKALEANNATGVDFIEQPLFNV